MDCRCCDCAFDPETTGSWRVATPAFYPGLPPRSDLICARPAGVCFSGFRSGTSPHSWRSAEGRDLLLCGVDHLPGDTVERADLVDCWAPDDLLAANDANPRTWLWSRQPHSERQFRALRGSNRTGTA